MESLTTEPYRELACADSAHDTVPRCEIEDEVAIEGQ